MTLKKGDVDTGSQIVEEKPIKVDKWDGSAVKNALDDAVKKVFTEKFKYTENFKLVDGRLAISGIAVGAASFALLWDYIHPFPDSKPILIICVASFDDIYSLYVSFTDGVTNKTREAEMSKSIASWFDTNGVLLYDLFEPEVSKLHASLLTEKKKK